MHKKSVTAFLVLSAMIAAAALAYFVMLETGSVRVTRELDNGSVYSGY